MDRPTDQQLKNSYQHSYHNQTSNDFPDTNVPATSARQNLARRRLLNTLPNTLASFDSSHTPASTTELDRLKDTLLPPKIADCSHFQNRRSTNHVLQLQAASRQAVCIETDDVMSAERYSLPASAIDYATSTHVNITDATGSLGTINDVAATPLSGASVSASGQKHSRIPISASHLHDQLIERRVRCRASIDSSKEYLYDAAGHSQMPSAAVNNRAIHTLRGSICTQEHANSFTDVGSQPRVFSPPDHPTEPVVQADVVHPCDFSARPPAYKKICTACFSSFWYPLSGHYTKCPRSCRPSCFRQPNPASNAFNRRIVHLCSTQGSYQRLLFSPPDHLIEPVVQVDVVRPCDFSILPPAKRPAPHAFPVSAEQSA